MEQGGISKLAELTGIPQPSLSRFFNSNAMPRKATVLKIAKALNLDEIKINDAASFVEEFNYQTQEQTIHIIVNEKHIGYVNQGLFPTFFNWINSNRIIDAWVEKINDTPGKTTIYLYVKISPANQN